MSNNPGYGGYQYYYSAQPHPQQHAADQRNPQRNSMANQLLGQVPVSGSSVGGIAVTSEYHSRAHQQDYFGAVQQQQSWTGQGSGQSTQSGAIGYDAFQSPQGHKLTALGNTGSGRVTSTSSHQPSTSLLGATENARQLSYPHHNQQQQQNDQAHYSKLARKSDPPLQYYRQHQQGASTPGPDRAITPSPNTTPSHATQQVTATSMQTVPAAYGHAYQPRPHLPNSTHGDSGYYQDHEQLQAQERQAPPAPALATRGYQATSHSSIKDSPSHGQHYPQLQGKNAPPAQSAIQAQSHRLIDQNSYEAPQKPRVLTQQHPQIAQTIHPQASMYYQQDQEPLNTSIPSRQAAGTSRASKFPENSCQVPTPATNTPAKSTSVTYNTQDVTPSSKRNAPQAASSLESYSTTYSTPSQKIPYPNAEPLALSKANATPEPARIQAPPQPTPNSSPQVQNSPLLQQHQAHLNTKIQVQADKVQVQPQIAKAQVDSHIKVPALEAQVRAQAKAQERAAKTQAKAQAKAQAQAQAQAQTQANSKAKAKAKDQTKDQAKDQAQSKAQAKAQGKARTEAHPQQAKVQLPASQHPIDTRIHPQLAQTHTHTQIQALHIPQAQQSNTEPTHQPRPQLLEQHQDPSPNASQTGAVGELPKAVNYVEMEKHMREMVERMRQYQAIDPNGFHVVWESVKRSGGLAGGATPEPQDIKSKGHSVSSRHTSQTPVSNATSSTPRTAYKGTVSQGVMPDKLREHGMDTPNQTNLSHHEPSHPSSPSAPTNSSEHVLRPITEVVQIGCDQGTPSNTPTHDAEQEGPPAPTVPLQKPIEERPPSPEPRRSPLPCQPSLTRLPSPRNSHNSPSTTDRTQPALCLEQTLPPDHHLRWPESQRMTLALSATHFMAANGCNNPPLSENWVLALLNKNPTFKNICETLEQAGYKFQRIPFARALLEKVNGSSEFRALTDAVLASGSLAETPTEAQPNSGNFPGHKKSPNIPKKELLAGDAQPVIPGDKHDLISTPTSASAISSATAVTYPPQILPPKNPTLQSIAYASPPVQQELAQPDKQFLSPHLLWHGPPSKDPQQSLFFNSDISYLQDTHLDSGLNSPQWNTHKIVQSTQPSEAGNPQPGGDGIVTNISLHPWTLATVSSNQPHSVPFVHPSAPVVRMAPVIGVASIASPALGATAGLSEQPILDSALEKGIGLGPMIVPALIDNQRIVKKISRRKAARSSTYDPKTIARDVLLTTGRHPHMAPLNNHMFPLLSIMGVYMDKNCDLETLRWDLVDPVPLGSAKVTELVDDNEDLVIGDLVPDSNALQDSLLSSQTREPEKHHWNKVRKDKKDADFKTEKTKENKNRSLEGTAVEEKAAKAPVTPKKLLKSSVRGEVSPRRTSLGGLLNSAIAAHKAAKIDTNQDRRATIGGAGVEKGKTFATRDMRKRSTTSTRVPDVAPLISPAATNSWASVNSPDAAVTPSRSRLAAVVINSRSPSLFEPNGDSPQAGSVPKRKNDGGVSGRPRKKRITGRTDNTGFSSHPAPLFCSYKCLWKDCRAELLSFEILKKHLFKTHKNLALYGGYPCLWEGCSRPSTANKVRKRRASEVKEEQYMDFNTEKDWENHLNEHLRIFGEIVNGENGELEISDAHHDSDLVYPAVAPPSVEKHLPLPPPPSQLVSTKSPRRGPRLKSMGARRSTGKDVVGQAKLSKRDVKHSHETEQQLVRGKAREELSNEVHVLSDDD